MVSNVGVIGAGQMGAGIAQVCAAIGKKVILCDIKQEFVDNGIETITKNLQRSISKKRIDKKNMTITLENITSTLDLNDLKGCDIIIEAIVLSKAMVFLTNYFKSRRWIWSEAMEFTFLN